MSLSTVAPGALPILGGSPIGSLRGTMVKVKETKMRKSKARLYIALAVVIVAAVVTSSVLTMVLRWQRAEAVGEVFVYLGSRELTKISINASEWEPIREGLLKLYLSNRSDVAIVMFGDRGCPHCRALADFLGARYQDKALILWVDEDQSAEMILFALIILELDKGVPYDVARGVPHTVVLGRDGAPKAVVIGEVRDASFWDKLLLLR